MRACENKRTVLPGFIVFGVFVAVATATVTADSHIYVFIMCI